MNRIKSLILKAAMFVFAASSVIGWGYLQSKSQVVSASTNSGEPSKLSGDASSKTIYVGTDGFAYFADYNLSTGAVTNLSRIDPDEEGEFIWDVDLWCFEGSITFLARHDRTTEVDFSTGSGVGKGGAPLIISDYAEPLFVDFDGDYILKGVSAPLFVGDFKFLICDTDAVDMPPYKPKTLIVETISSSIDVSSDAKSSTLGHSIIASDGEIELWVGNISIKDKRLFSFADGSTPKNSASAISCSTLTIDDGCSLEVYSNASYKQNSNNRGYSCVSAGTIKNSGFLYLTAIDSGSSPLHFTTIESGVLCYGSLGSKACFRRTVFPTQAEYGYAAIANSADWTETSSINWAASGSAQNKKRFVYKDNSVSTPLKTIMLNGAGTKVAHFIVEENEEYIIWDSSALCSPFTPIGFKSGEAFKMAPRDSAYVAFYGDFSVFDDAKTLPATLTLYNKPKSDSSRTAIDRNSTSSSDVLAYIDIGTNVDDNLANLHMDSWLDQETRDSGDCQADFLLVKSQIESASVDVRHNLKNDPTYSDAYARLLSWAKNCGWTIRDKNESYSGKTYHFNSTSSSGTALGFEFVQNNQLAVVANSTVVEGNNIAVCLIVAASIIAVVSFTVIMVVSGNKRKRKEER